MCISFPDDITDANVTGWKMKMIKRNINLYENDFLIELGSLKKKLRYHQNH